MNPRFLLFCAAICLAICLAMPGAAHAGFTIVNAPGAVPPETQVLPPPNLSMTTSYPLTIVSGFGRDIPLSIAIKQIVPAGVHVSFDANVDTSLPVTWRGGKDWQDVLADAIRPNSLYAVENPSGVVITAVRPAFYYGMTGAYQNASGMQTSLTPIEYPSWTAKGSDTLRQTLENWCKKANVTLQWDSEYDYPIETDVNLTGDFETSVRELLRGLKNATPSPVANYYRPKPGLPGILVVPSPSGDNHAGHTDTPPSSGLPPAVLPAISNIPQS